MLLAKGASVDIPDENNMTVYRFLVDNDLLKRFSHHPQIAEHTKSTRYVEQDC
jgi:hypothetical protein